MENTLKITSPEANDEESHLITDVFNTLGVEPEVAKPEISALGFNESQFNGLGDDSQFNDVIEVSAFTKPSMVGRFLDREPHQENELVKRARLMSERQENLEPGKKDQGLFEQPQNFPDLDTSGIEVEVTHHIDKEFGDGDGSFIGFKEHNSYDGEEVNDIFGEKKSPNCPDEDNIPITPQMGVPVRFS